LPTNVQNFTQKDLTKVKIFLLGFLVLGEGLLFLKHTVQVPKVQIQVRRSFH